MTDNFQKDMSDVLFNIDDYIHVMKGNWVENELQAAERQSSDDVERIKMIRDVLQIFDDDEKKLVESMQSLERLHLGKPLTPILGLDEEWTLYCAYPYLSGISCNVYYNNRMPSLLKYHIFDEKKERIKYSDVNRVQVIRNDRPGVRYRSKRITKLLDDLCPITMPYYPRTDSIKIMVFDSMVGDIDYRFYDDTFLYDTFHIMWIEPHLELPNRYYKIDANGDLVSIDFKEYIDRIERSSNDQETFA